MFTALASIDGWQAGAILIKTMTYGASLAAAGGVLFRLIFQRDLLKGYWQPIGQLSAWLAIAGLVVGLCRVPWTSAMLIGDPAGLWDSQLLSLVLNSSDGQATMLRSLGLALVIIGAFRGVWASALASIGAVLVVVSFALAGHSAALDLAPWPQILLILHLAAVAYWIGAFLPLLWLARQDEPRNLGKVAHRFGVIAAYFVGVLVIVGTILLWLLAKNPAAFIAAEYGRIFSAKLALVAVLLGLAALNKLRLTPLILAGDPRGLRRLGMSVRAEIVVATLILLVTATFTTVTGPPALN